MGDIRTTTGQKPPETASERKIRKNRLFRNLFIFLVLVGLAGYFIKLPRYAYATGYATTMGYAEIRAAVEGRVDSVLRTSGDLVQEGDILMQLDAASERAAHEQALSQIAEARAELAYKQADYADQLKRHANAIRLAEMELEQTKKNLELTRQLYENSLTSGRQLSADEFAVRRGEEALNALRDIDMSVAEKQIAALRQNIESLTEAANRAKIALDHRTIRATCAGRLVRYTFYPGEIIRPDMVLYEIFDGDVNTMKVRIPERYAAKVKIGQPVGVRLGTHKALIPRRFPGQVDVLRPVVEGDGTDNYRVAYCGFDRKGEDVPPGTGVEARILIGRASLWTRILEP